MRDDFLGYVTIDLKEIVALVSHNEAQQHRFLLAPDKAGAVTLRFEVA